MIKILTGDCLKVLPTLESESVQSCITSPPYYGLRNYGVDLQIGLEPSPEEYVEKLVAVFREVKRVLRDDGTLWLVIGDSYWGGRGKSGYELPEEAEARRAKGKTFQTAHNVPGNRDMRPTDGKHPVIKPKDLIGIPWMVAFALRNDGWYLRADIIWHKPNPMPESVTDRPTRSHEHIFLLTKSARYYYDADAIREKSKWVDSDGRPIDSWGRTIEIKTSGNGQTSRGGTGVPQTLGANVMDGKRNKRDVWTVSTSSYPEAHFATFPPKLIEPCILAGTSPKACEHCGAPWKRVTETIGLPRNDKRTHSTKEQRQGKTPAPEPVKGGNTSPIVTTMGWHPTCDCENTGAGRCIVLDPFAGSGTTGAVSIKHGRSFIGVELNPKYVEMIHARLADVQPVLV